MFNIECIIIKKSQSTIVIIMCQRAPIMPNMGVMNQIAASSTTPFGHAAAHATPLVPYDSDISHPSSNLSTTNENISTKQSTKQSRMTEMKAQANEVESKRANGWMQTKSIIPQVQCGINFSVEGPFNNRGYVKCAMLNETPIEGQTVGGGAIRKVGKHCYGPEHFTNHMGGKPTSAFWWPNEWHGEEGRYGTSLGTWKTGTNEMPQYVPGRSGYMVDPWGSANL